MPYSQSGVFAILLDSPRRSWTSGDRITGKVVLKSIKDESVGAVTITLFGRAKAKIIVRRGKKRRIVRSRATLLTEGLVLYSSHFTLRKDVYEWPFEFVIPSTAQRIMKESWEPEKPYNNEPGHLLPPTMSFLAEGLFGGRQFECFTEYNLQAKLDRPAEDQSIFSLDSGYETAIPLYYEQTRMSSPVPAEPVHHNARIDIRSLLLDPSHSTKLTFKEKMKSTFSSSSLPVSTFTVSITIPTQVNLGGSLKFGVRLKHETERSTAPEIPDVQVHLSLSIIKQVAVRADRVFLTDHAKASNQVIFNKGFPGHPLNEGSGYSHEFAIDCMDIPNCEPCFETYNIAQTYILEVTCNVKCVDKTEKMVRGGRFMIYPRVGGSVSTPATAPPMEPHEPLPRYEEVAEASSSRNAAAPAQSAPQYRFDDDDTDDADDDDDDETEKRG